MQQMITVLCQSVEILKYDQDVLTLRIEDLEQKLKKKEEKDKASINAQRERIKEAFGVEPTLKKVNGEKVFTINGEKMIEKIREEMRERMKQADLLREGCACEWCTEARTDQKEREKGPE